MASSVISATPQVASAVINKASSTQTAGKNHVAAKRTGTRALNEVRVEPLKKVVIQAGNLALEAGPVMKSLEKLGAEDRLKLSAEFKFWDYRKGPVGEAETQTIETKVRDIFVRPNGIVLTTTDGKKLAVEPDTKESISIELAS